VDAETDKRAVRGWTELSIGVKQDSLSTL
jgi:hypothetical protein